MWRNLQGILQLVVKDDFTVETAGPKVKTVIARSCRMDDFGELTAAIREMAFRTAASIAVLDGMLPKSPYRS